MSIKPFLFSVRDTYPIRATVKLSASKLCKTVIWRLRSSCVNLCNCAVNMTARDRNRDNKSLAELPWINKRFKKLSTDCLPKEDTQIKQAAVFKYQSKHCDKVNEGVWLKGMLNSSVRQQIQQCVLMCFIWTLDCGSLFSVGTVESKLWTIMGDAPERVCVCEAQWCCSCS